jgi:phosphatidylinositol glycan class F
MLTTPPLFYTRGVSASAWREICSITAPFDECFGGAVGALVGAWVGAVPIPLDWDREWQAWPVTVVVGAVGGWVLGRVVGGTVARGGRLKWAE